MTEQSSRETRTRIVEAAAGKFAAFGFRAATMKQIAAAAAVNDVTVYRHFPKKQQLYWAAIDWKFRNSALRQIIAESFARPGRPRDLLRELGERVLTLLLNDESLGRLIYFAFLELPEEKKRLYDGHLRPLVESLSEQLKNWERSGEIRSVDPRSSAVAILGMLWSPYYLHEVIGMQYPNEEFVRRLAGEFSELCLRGLEVHPPQKIGKKNEDSAAISKE